MPGSPCASMVVADLRRALFLPGTAGLPGRSRDTAARPRRWSARSKFCRTANPRVDKHIHRQAVGDGIQLLDVHLHDAVVFLELAQVHCGQRRRRFGQQMHANQRQDVDGDDGQQNAETECDTPSVRPFSPAQSSVPSAALAPAAVAAAGVPAVIGRHREPLEATGHRTSAPLGETARGQVNSKSRSSWGFHGMTTANSCINVDFAAANPAAPAGPCDWIVTRYFLVLVQMWVERSAKSSSARGPLNCGSELLAAITAELSRRHGEFRECVGRDVIRQRRHDTGHRLRRVGE